MYTTYTTILQCKDQNMIVRNFLISYQKEATLNNFSANSD